MFKFISLFVLFLCISFAGVKTSLAANSVDTTIGSIDTPPGVTEQIAAANLAPDEIAIFFFLSSLIKVVNVVAGIWVAFNIVFAGFNYLSGQGSADTHKKVRDKITMSFVGLFLLAIAYMAVAVISLLLFGDAGYVLKPDIVSRL
ncbi:hypothetical protein KBC89_00500 [Candidatus Woesebacteria bacterium]|nr:hypothetical protein [Candidatus Woesebacteria bacterium]